MTGGKNSCKNKYNKGEAKNEVSGNEKSLKRPKCKQEARDEIKKNKSEMMIND